MIDKYKKLSLLICNMVLEFLSNIYFGNTLLAWVYFFATVIVFVLIAKSIIYFTKGFGRRITSKIKGDLDDKLLDLIEEPAAFLMFTLGVYLGYQFLTFDTTIDFYFYNVIQLLGIIGVTWVIIRLIDTALDTFIKPITGKTKSKFDDQIIQVLSKALKAVVILLAIIISLDNFGFDVVTLIAGLGIGGLAFAFAAQKTIADVFGGLSILISRPFVLGDTIDVNGQVGGVEEISLRHTKIRNLDKRIVVIPNSMVAESVITNITSAPKRKIVWKLGVTYDTSVKQIEKAKKIITNTINKSKDCAEDPIVYFEEFAGSSLNILVVFFTKTGDFMQMAKARDEVGLKIKKEFEKEGIEFAFPTQTVYVEGMNPPKKQVKRKK
jgi:MscS family membrane protein